MSLSWLDDSFKQVLDKCDELEKRVEDLSAKLHDANTEIFGLKIQTSRLGTIELIVDRVINALKDKPTKAKK
jgi:hypothetical protein